MDVFSAFGLSASAGLNAYIPLLVVAILAKYTDLIKLDQPWNALTSWWVIGLLILLSLIEFFADKIPAVNHVNDVVQTFVRPAAGAIVFAASSHVVTNIHPVLSMIAGIIIAGAVHAAKALAVRPAVTATTGGTANVPVSILEDFISTITSIAAVLLPMVVAVIIMLVLLLFIVWLWRRTNNQNIW